jgi:hypothetical protein
MDFPAQSALKLSGTKHGIQTYLLEGCSTVLQTFNHGPHNRGWKKTGRRTAKLEVTIDVDALLHQLAVSALRTRNGRLTRLQGVIKVKPIDLQDVGTGDPR